MDGMALSREGVEKLAVRSLSLLWSPSTLSILAVIVLWFALTEDGFGVIGRLKYPSPRQVIETIVDLGPNLTVHVFATFTRLFTGLLIGSLAGIALGLAMMRSPLLHAVLDPQIESMRPVPPIAMIPFFILWFGLAETGKVLIISLGTFMVLVVATVEAVRNVPPIYARAARTLGASEGAVFRTIFIPAIVPQLIGAVRVAAAAAFGLAVAAEFLGAQEGLGYLIINARRTLNTGLILVSVLLMGVLSSLLDRFIRRGARWLTEWSEREPA
jgi:ABC-type nitrate/sulfonate/bicarbonate transport system permease component